MTRYVTDPSDEDGTDGGEPEFPHLREYDLTLFQHHILFVLARKDAPSGLDVKARLEQIYGANVNHGRLYPNLDDLVEMGLVDKGQQDRRTNWYDLTEAGAELVVANANLWLSAADEVE